MNGFKRYSSLMILPVLVLSLLMLGLFNQITTAQPSSQGNDVQIIELLPSDDTFVWQFKPNNAFGHESYMWVYPDDAYPMLKFSLDQVPPGAEIISATLTLTMSPDAYPWGGGDVAAVQLLSNGDWDEGTLTWNNMPDIDPNAPEAVSTLNPYAAWNTDTWDVTQLLQYALGSQSGSLRSQGTITATLPVRIFPKAGDWFDSHEWRSKENNDTSAPQLEIAYRVVSPTSTPTSTPTPTPTPTYRFGGQVLGPNGTPMQGVRVKLHARREEDPSWTSLRETVTDSNGRFSFPVWDGGYDDYRVVMENPPGWTCSGAIADQGTVIDCSTIEYRHPQPGSYTQNIFYLTRATPTPPPTPTATPTPTPEIEVVKVAAVPQNNPVNSIAPGQEVTYTVSLTWDSPDDSSAPSSMTDPIPQYTTYITNSARANLGSVHYNPRSQSIVWNGEIPDGQTAIISFRVKVDCTALMALANKDWPRNIVNQASGEIAGYPFQTPPKALTLLKPDLQITGMEVTQVIQNLDNVAPLIKGKDTYVRVYIRARYPNDVPGCDVPDVSARLVGEHGELTPINRSITAQVLAGKQRPTYDERKRLNQSLVFRLPHNPEWAQGAYTLSAWLNPLFERPDEDARNNVKDQNVSFVDGGSIRLYVFLMDGYYVPVREIAAPIFTMMHPYPLPDSNLRTYWKGTIAEYEDENLADRCGVLGGGWLELDPDCLVDAVNAQRPWSFLESRDAHYVGLVHEDEDLATTTGIAFRPGRAALVKMQSSLKATARTLAHELGHNMGLRHVNCPPGGPSNPDPNWPYPSCWLGHGTNRGSFGLDTRPYFTRPGLEVLDPKRTGDIMSYAHKRGIPRWPSNYTYWRLHQALKNREMSQQRAATATRQRFLVQGVITDTAQVAGTLEPLYTIDNPYFQDETPDGSYTVETVDANGQVLAQAHLCPTAHQ